jgi:hypothetical protein
MVKKENTKHDRIEYDFLEHLLKCPLLKSLYSDFYINKEIKNYSGSYTYCELDLLLMQKMKGATYRADVFEIKSNGTEKLFYKAVHQMRRISYKWNTIYKNIGYNLNTCIEPHYWLVTGKRGGDYTHWEITNLDKLVEDKR